MNAKHRRTLAALYANPIRRTIKWDDVASLFAALGTVDETAAGSRVDVTINGTRASFHKPHPGNEVKVYVVKLIRTFLDSSTEDQ